MAKTITKEIQDNEVFVGLKMKKAKFDELCEKNASLARGQNGFDAMNVSTNPTTREIEQTRIYPDTKAGKRKFFRDSLRLQFAQIIASADEKEAIENARKSITPDANAFNVSED